MCVCGERELHEGTKGMVRVRMYEGMGEWMYERVGRGCMRGCVESPVVYHLPPLSLFFHLTHFADPHRPPPALLLDSLASYRRLSSTRPQGISPHRAPSGGERGEGGKRERGLDGRIRWERGRVKG